MAATKRQASTDAASRKRGTYKRGLLEQLDALEPGDASDLDAGYPRPSVEAVVVSKAQRRRWASVYAASSPLEDAEARDTLAEALAAARATVEELGSVPSMVLTDGQSRAYGRSLKEVRDLTKALGLDKIDKARGKRARAAASSASSGPGASTSPAAIAAQVVASMAPPTPAPASSPAAAPPSSSTSTASSRPPLASSPASAPSSAPLTLDSW